jgi:hypothetical protein
MTNPPPATLRTPVLVVVGAALLSVPLSLAREICTSSGTHTFHVKVNLFASELGAYTGTRAAAAVRARHTRLLSHVGPCCLTRLSPLFAPAAASRLFAIFFFFFSFFFACVRVL